MKNLIIVLAIGTVFALGWFTNDGFHPQKAHAAGRKYKLAVSKWQGPELEKTLDQFGQDGWRVIQIVPVFEQWLVVFEQ